MRSFGHLAAVAFTALALTIPAMAGQDEPTIPAGSELFLSLGTQLGNKTARSSDPFFATVAVPLTVDDRIIVPVGSQILGNVSRVTKAKGKDKRNSWIQLSFHTLIFPDGTHFELEGVLTQSEDAADGETEEDLPTTLSGVAVESARHGLDKLVGLFKKEERVIPKNAMINIKVQNQVRLVAKKK